MEGALSSLMAWDLERNEIPWNSHVYLDGEDDTEKDLIFKLKGTGGVCIVECKSYYRDTNDRVRHDNLSGLLRQLDQHVGKYRARGIPVAEAILATNYPVTPETETFVAETISDGSGFQGLRATGVRLVGPGKLRSWWKK
jgi:hypothetical protein